MMHNIVLDPATEQAAKLFLRSLDGKFDWASAILFGSRARHAFQPDSDADVALVLRGEPQRFLPIKLALADIAFDVMLETGIRIQPFPIWEDEWQHPETYSNPRLLENIAREGVQL